MNPYAPKAPHFTPRATAVISLFMGGGWSQMDTFDPKPALTKYAGQPIDDKVKGDVIVRQGSPGPLMPSPFSFKKYGQSGIEVSEIFPHLSQHVDEIAFLRSVYGRSNDHVQGTYEMQTGQINLGFPSVGSWVTYGLGSVSSSLPAFVVMTDARGGPLGGPNDWSAGYMPAAYQGTLFRSTGDPIVDLKPPSSVTPEDQRARLDALAKLNELDMQKFPGNTELAARISSYELAYRMQGCAPEAVDVVERVRADQEALRPRRQGHRAVRPPVPDGAPAGRARRPLRAGVLGRRRQPERRHLGRARRRPGEPHPARRGNRQADGRACCRTCSARGLLDSTLVILHSEFGRMPISQRGVGRDHNPGTQTVLMAGAGIKGGQVIGASDDFGYKALEQPISYHDLHATMLHLLGLDHKKLTYRFNGRDMRLTDVYGTLIPQIVNA